MSWTNIIYDIDTQTQRIRQLKISYLKGKLSYLQLTIELNKIGYSSEDALKIIR